MGQIYLVRHGQTAWNKARIFRGRTDVQLNEQGRREAVCAARALRDVPLACVYTSPLSRARETAENIARLHGVSVCAEPAFVDIDYGRWTEYWDMEVRRKFRDQHELWERSPERMRFPGGESLQDVRARAVPRLGELAKRHGAEAVAMVSHRVVLKLLLCEAKGLDNSHFWDIRLDTAAISLVESNGASLKLIVENDTRHVQSLLEHDSVDF